jgi:hypothetical protein
VTLGSNYLYRNFIMHYGAILYDKNEVSDKYVEHRHCWNVTYDANKTHLA